MRKINIAVGDRYTSKSCGDFEVIEILSYKKIKVRFVATGFETWVQGGQVTDGRISDKLSPTVYGVGVLGLVEGQVNNRKSYKIWHSMLQRCYSDNVKTRERSKTYGDVAVCQEWLTYTNFLVWFENNYKEGSYLDKDLTIIGSKEYSPETCSFVTNLINCLLWRTTSNKGEWPIGVHKDVKSGKFVAQLSVKGLKRKWLGYHNTPEEAFIAYKEAKENLIREVAFEAFHKGDINRTVYDNLIAFEVTP